MNKLRLTIAALHAGALALVAQPGAARAQDATEVRAYMNALAVGTPEAMAAFLAAFPASTLPGSELGASIAASIQKTQAAAAPPAAAPAAPARPAVAAAPKPSAQPRAAAPAAPRRLAGSFFAGSLRDDGIY